MAKITIGGNEYVIPEMNFIAVERAWPYVEKAMETIHPMHGTSAALSVIAAAMMEGPDFDPASFGIEVNEQDAETGLPRPRGEDAIFQDLTKTLKRRLKAREVGTVKLCLFEILEEAGFEMKDPASGEALAALGMEMMSPSLVTAANTSPSSSQPDAKEEAGTE